MKFLKRFWVCFAPLYALVMFPRHDWLLWRVFWHFAALCLWPFGLLIGLQVVIWCLEEPWQDFQLRRAQVRRHRMFSIKPIHHYSSKATYVGTQPTTPKEGAQ